MTPRTESNYLKPEVRSLRTSFCLQSPMGVRAKGAALCTQDKASPGSTRCGWASPWSSWGQVVPAFPTEFLLQLSEWLHAPKNSVITSMRAGHLPNTGAHTRTHAHTPTHICTHIHTSPSPQPCLSPVFYCNGIFLQDDHSQHDCFSEASS